MSPSFSRPFHNFLGIAGTALVCVSIMVYARVNDSDQKNPDTFEFHQEGDISEPSIAISEVASVESIVEYDIVKGKTNYTLFCASCHGMPGQERTPTMTGSNLFDRETTFGNDREAIKRITEQGVIEQGMVPWKAVFSEDDLNGVVEFILTEMQH